MATRFVQPQAAPQVTTNSYVTVDASVCDAHDTNYVKFAVKEVGGTNGITAKLVGRYVTRDTNGGVINATGWIDANVSNTAAASATSTLESAQGETHFDQYAVQIKSTVNGSHGQVYVFGSVANVEQVASETRTLTFTVAAEIANVISVAIQSSHASADGYIVRALNSNRELVANTVITMTETGAGAIVSTTARPALEFTLSAGGAATIAVTDVAGGSGATFMLEFTPVDVTGPTQKCLVTFD